MKPTFIDLFAGIGGMRSGFERAGWKCVGFSEYDRFARQSYKAMYDTEGEWENHDIRTVNASDMPRADLWTYGFPCQGISVAGKQKGIGKGAEDTEADERSNLFFQVIRLLSGLTEEAKPTWLLCENVKNLLSIDRGYGFARILYSLDEMGYDSEWQLFNTKYSYAVGGCRINGIPQNRERVYIVSHLRSRGRREVFPIPRTDRQDTCKLYKIAGEWGMNHQAGSVYDKKGCSPSLDTCGGGAENQELLREIIPSKANITMVGGLQAHQTSVVVRPVLTPDREEKRQNGRRMKENGEPMFTLTAQDRHGVAFEGEQVPINTNIDGTSRCICAGLYKQNWSHFDPTRDKQTYTGVAVYETDTNKICKTEKG